MDICFVQYGSGEWSEARAIRHAAFFERHGLPLSVLDDEYEQRAALVVVVDDGTVVGCGRLYDSGGGEFRISQMAVVPALQQRGIGAALLGHLVREAEAAGAKSIELDSRLTAVAFYARAGFEQHGSVFPSSKTRVPHVRMRYLPGKRLNDGSALGDVDSAGSREGA